MNVCDFYEILWQKKSVESSFFDALADFQQNWEITSLSQHLYSSLWKQIKMTVYKSSCRNTIVSVFLGKTGSYVDLENIDKNFKFKIKVEVLSIYVL